MGLRSAVVNGALNLVFRLLCRIDDAGLRRIPLRGPAVLIANHTSNLEAPLLYVRLRPRATIGLAKAELWRISITRMIMQAWSAIPLHRGRLDRAALARSARVLERGDFLCLAPEGRRSRSGELERGKAGAVWFAAERGVPIYPIAQWGVRTVMAELARGHRPRITIRVGRPFRVAAGVHGDDLQAATDEMMLQLAQLLPETLRGYYRGLPLTTRYLEFLEDEP
jgi:1-acyl-sn-glycerol-3-phosphate acyltransferase